MKGNGFYCIDLGITKCYLIKCQEGFMLVDTGYNSDYSKFIRKLCSLNINLSSIRYIFLTHHHDDHVGFASKLLEETNSKLIVHEKAVTPLKSGESEDSMKPVNLRIKLVFYIFELFHKSFKYPPVNIKQGDIVLKHDDNEVLASLGIKGKILYTPGHSNDSMSIILDDGTAFVGDAAMNFLNVCGIKYRPIYIENEEQVYDSWKKLIENGASIIYPAHGLAFPAKRLEYYRDYFLKKQ